MRLGGLQADLETVAKGRIPAMPLLGIEARCEMERKR
jgi:hypothetical protein